MAWGILIAGLTMIGMFGLAIFEASLQEPPSVGTKRETEQTPEHKKAA